LWLTAAIAAVAVCRRGRGHAAASATTTGGITASPGW
jgi:hypothetical protein